MEKKTNLAVIILFLAILALIMVGLPMFNKSQKNDVANAATEPQEITIGNSTFIPLPMGLAGHLTQKKLEMETVKKFEKAHPEFVVSCWNPTYTVDSMNVAVDGVQIYHKLK